MPVTGERVDATRRLIESIGAIVGFVAPTSALIAVGRLPSHVALMAGAILLAVTTAFVITVFIHDQKIGRLGGKWITLIIALCALTGSVLTTVYERVADELIAEERHWDGDRLAETHRFVIPLNPSPRIIEIVDEFYGNYDRAIILSRYQAELKTLMRRQETSAVLAILGLMVLAQLLLVAAILIGASWLAQRAAPNAGAEPKPKSKR